MAGGGYVQRRPGGRASTRSCGFAEATNRLDLYRSEKRGTDLPEILQRTTEKAMREEGAIRA